MGDSEGWGEEFKECSSLPAMWLGRFQCMDISTNAQTFLPSPAWEQTLEVLAGPSPLQKASCPSPASLREGSEGRGSPQPRWSKATGQRNEKRHCLYQGSQVSLRVARRSALWLSSNGRGLGPQDALKRDSRGLSQVVAGKSRFPRLLPGSKTPIRLLPILRSTMIFLDVTWK